MIAVRYRFRCRILRGHRIAADEAPSSKGMRLIASGCRGGPRPHLGAWPTIAQHSSSEADSCAGVSAACQQKRLDSLKLTRRFSKNEHDVQKPATRRKTPTVDSTADRRSTTLRSRVGRTPSQTGRFRCRHSADSKPPSPRWAYAQARERCRSAYPP